MQTGAGLSVLQWTLAVKHGGILIFDFIQGSFIARSSASMWQISPSDHSDQSSRSGVFATALTVNNRTAIEL
jgi:hypothetical protein